MSDSIIPASSPGLAPLSAEEAEDLVGRINALCASAGALIVELRDRDGWRALGFTTWRECAAARLGMSVRRVYELAAYQDFCAMAQQADLPLPDNERLARPLTRLDPELQPPVWKQVIGLAPNGHVTAPHVERIVREVAAELETEKRKRGEERAAVAALVERLNIQPVDEEKENERIQLTHKFFEAIHALADLPAPASLIGLIPDYQRYRMDELPDALTWLEQFARLWEETK